jgi:hypothetical protein
VNCTPAHLRTSAPDTKSCQTSCGTSNTRLVPRDDGILFQPRDLRWRRSGGRTWTRTSDPTESKGAHAVEFSKTVAPCREGVTFERTLPTSPRAQGAGSSSLAPLDGGCAARLEAVVAAPLKRSIRTARSRTSSGRHADAPPRSGRRPDPLWRKAIRGPTRHATAKWSSSRCPDAAPRAVRRSDQVVKKAGSNLGAPAIPSNAKGSCPAGKDRTHTSPALRR